MKTWSELPIKGFFASPDDDGEHDDADAMATMTLSRVRSL